MSRRGFDLHLALAGGILALFIAAHASAATLAEELVLRLHTGFDGAGSEEEVEHLAVLDRFYQERRLAPLWVSDQGATARAIALAGILGDADADGLDPQDYGAGAVDALLSGTEPEQLAELELRLSLGLIQITSDLASGRLEPSQVDPELFIFPAEVDHTTPR